MNRTASHRSSALAALLSALALPLGFAGAQEPAAKAQTPTPESVVAAMRAQEAAASSIVLALETTGRLAGGLTFAARGSVRVLRAAQPEASASHTVVDYDFGDGLSGRVESVETKDGLLTLQQDPTFGETFVRIDATVMKDLAWASAADSAGDAPFQAGPRARSPIGAELFADLAQRFDLRIADKPAPEGMKGAWWQGERKKASDSGDNADLPLADRVEAFVREGDSVLMDVVYTQKGEVVQRVRLTNAVLGAPLQLSSFRIDAGGKKPIDAKEHGPTWQQIEQTLQRASQKRNGELPPSRK